jgi:hypothetical protein
MSSFPGPVPGIHARTRTVMTTAATNLMCGGFVWLAALPTGEGDMDFWHNFRLGMARPRTIVRWSIFHTARELPDVLAAGRAMNQLLTRSRLLTSFRAVLGGFLVMVRNVEGLAAGLTNDNDIRQAFGYAQGLLVTIPGAVPFAILETWLGFDLFAALLASQKDTFLELLTIAKFRTTNLVSVMTGEGLSHTGHVRV